MKNGHAVTVPSDETRTVASASDYKAETPITNPAPTISAASAPVAPTTPSAAAAAALVRAPMRLNAAKAPEDAASQKKMAAHSTNANSNKISK